MRARLTAALLALELCGCQVPVVREGEGSSITVMCVLSSCVRLLQDIDASERRVTVACVFAKCAGKDEPAR